MSETEQAILIGLAEELAAAGVPAEPVHDPEQGIAWVEVRGGCDLFGGLFVHLADGRLCLCPEDWGDDDTDREGLIEVDLTDPDSIQAVVRAVKGLVGGKVEGGS